MWLATAANAAAVPDVAITFFTLAAAMRSTTRLTSRVTNPRRRFSLSLAGRIVSQEFIGEANRAQRKADGVADVATLRDGQFATAAAEVHHQRGTRVYARAGDRAPGE